MRRNIFAGIFGVVAFSMIGLSALAEDDNSQENGPDPRIGEEVSRICFSRNIDGWRTVKGVDNVILLERGIRNWYYVELMGGCSYSTLNFAFAIGIDTRPSGGCVTRGDHIIVEDHPMPPRRCTIRRIYEWDDNAKATEESEEPDQEESSEDASASES